MTPWSSMARQANSSRLEELSRLNHADPAGALAREWEATVIRSAFRWFWELLGVLISRKRKACWSAVNLVSLIVVLTFRIKKQLVSQLGTCLWLLVKFHLTSYFLFDTYISCCWHQLHGMKRIKLLNIFRNSNFHIDHWVESKSHNFWWPFAEIL